MNETSAARRIDGKMLLLCGVAALLAGFVAVSPQSFWIDEAGTVDQAVMPTFSAWWGRLRWENNSNLQLPLYLLYAWAWEKIFGHGEWALRAANLPWFVLGAASLGAAFRTLARPAGWAALTLVLSSFAWFYLNDARPYAMQMGASCFVFAALIALGAGPSTPQSERRWAAALGVGSLVLAASGMVAMMWLGAGLGALLLGLPWERTRRLLLHHLPTWGVTALSLLALGVYYLWTMTLGARATVIATTDLRSILFVFYELLGFMGLGPGRLAIRTGGLATFKPYLGPLLVYGALLAWLGWLGLRNLRLAGSKRAVAWTITAMAGMWLLLLGIGMSSRFRVLGRHCTPLWPVLIFPVILGASVAWQRRDRWSRIALLAFFTLSLVSCLTLRFSPRHGKDDYRGAAALAREWNGRGERVWWNADLQSALYYAVPLASTPGEAGKVTMVDPPGPTFAATVPMPDVIIVSKPDVYDLRGAVAAFLTTNQFQVSTQLPAFTIWRRKH